MAKFKMFFRQAAVMAAAMVVGCGTIIWAGSLTPTSDPAASGYTLADIYNRLDTNAPATAGDHSFSPSASPSGSLYTLTQIYDKIPAIDGTKILEGTTYLGVDGAIAIKDSVSGEDGQLEISLPDGYYGGKTCTASDTNLVAGNIKSGATIFGTAGALLPSGGAATASNVLSGATFFGAGQSDWNLQTGTMANIGAQTITPSTSNQTITLGYHNGEGYCAGDADLISTNIKSGVNLFGVDGDGNVADTSTGDAVAGDILSGKIAWVDGSEITGNIAAQTLSADSETVAAGYYEATTLSAVDADLAAGNIASGTTIFGVAGNYSASYTWTKAGSGSWEGVNENLDWAANIGPSGWSSQTYSYCVSGDCTNDGSLQGAASYDGPPGGWNGSNDYTNFNNSALHNYEVITADDTDLGDCTADAGDLVFPDGSVWDKSNAKPYSVKLSECDSNDDNAAAIWAAAGGSGAQYRYARNAPSAVSIADAWDGKKNLTTGANNTHSYDNDGKNDDYYDRPAVSWYADTGDGAGTSRLPMIEEYERARQGTSESVASLLYGTNSWSYHNWSAEQYPNSSSIARTFNPLNGSAGGSDVNSQTRPLWLVVAGQ